MPVKDVRNLKTRTGKHGGTRKNAGRKKSEAVRIKRDLEKRVAEIVQHMAESGWIKDATDYAMALHIDVMHDKHKPVNVRMFAANWVWEHLIGKPKQEQEVKGDLRMTVESRVETFFRQIEKVYGPLTDVAGVTATGTVTSAGSPDNARDGSESGYAARTD